MESLELQSLEAFTSMMQHVLKDALARLVEQAPKQAPAFSQLAVYSFRQTWPDASCGFGGITLPVLTDAQTIVVSWTDGNVVLIYIRGEFAYRLTNPTQMFWEQVAAHHLPGAADSHTHLSNSDGE